MKFCYECGCKLEGGEKTCPECGEIFKKESLIGEEILNHMFEDLDSLKNEAIDFIDDFDFEDFVDDISANSKKALNRDSDYLKRARKKLEKAIDDKRIIELCDKAIALDEFSSEAYYLKGRALINMGRYDEAIESLISSLALNEDNIDARVYIAKAYYLKHDLDYASGVYDSILYIDPNHFEALKEKALIYFDKQDWIEADKYFRMANDVFSLDNDVKYKWDMTLKKLKEE